VRLISYNILDGGEGRADPLAEVILAGHPDIVVLVEADDPAVLDRISGRLGMDCITGVGKSHASAILSRWPIRESINHALLRPVISNSLLEATIIDPEGREWIVGALHLPAGATEADESRREVELAELLDVFAHRRSEHQPHIIAGDFNSNSPSQKIDPARCKPRTKQEWDENGGKLPRRVIQKMLDAGYRDAFADIAPQSAAITGTFSTQFPGQRVDYTFAHGFATGQVHTAWVEQDRLAKYCSDHFPIGVEIYAGDGR
jgi:endonuclease/exonuclease/phosphatase family metal-dependent hydrolase